MTSFCLQWDLQNRRCGGMLGPRYDHLHDVIIHFLTYVYVFFYLSKDIFEEFYGKMIQSA
jgi:hypothetical protein